MNITLFSDWLEEERFGTGELAHLIADIIDEATSQDAPGLPGGHDRADQGLLASAWEAAQQEDGAVRARAAVVLGRLGYAKAEPALLEARKCPDSSIARAAAIVLARLHPIDDELLEALVQTVEDPAESREIRSAAARTIAHKQSLATTTRLSRMAESEDPDLAQYGLEALGVVRPELGSEEHRVALQALLAALRQKDPMLKITAAEALGSFGDPAAVKDLEMVLIEKDAAVRRRALFALARLGAESAKAPLTRMLRDFSIPARWEIVDLLAHAYGEAIVDALALAAQDRDPELRDHLVTALGQMDGPSSLALLRKTAQDDPDAFVREQAAAALARRGAEPAPKRVAPAAAVAEPAAPAPEPARAPEPSPAPRAPEPAAVPAEAKAPAMPTLRPLFGPSPETAPPPPAPTEPPNAIERALESMECTWWLDPSGYQVQVAIANTKERVSILLGELDYEESPVYRFIVHCGMADPKAYDAALRNNRDLAYGALAVTDVAGRPAFVLTETLLASAATPASVRKALLSLARSSARLRSTA